MNDRSDPNALLRGIIDRYLNDIESVWPEDSYFHDRNRQKVGHALRQLKGLGPMPGIDDILSLLTQRRQSQTATVYVVSCGSSGCHFLGQLLHGLPGYTCINEVYFPAEVLNLDESSPAGQTGLAIDFINLLHTGRLDRPDEIVVNLAHLRPEWPLATLVSLNEASRVVALIRNPCKVAISRAFRKEAYRTKVGQGLDDDGYLLRQVRHVQRFMNQMRHQFRHRTVRYEQLNANTMVTMVDVLADLNLPGSGSDLRATIQALQRHGQAGSAAVPGNLNTSARPQLTANQQALLESELGAVAKEYGYDKSPVSADTPRADKESPAGV